MRNSLAAKTILEKLYTACSNCDFTNIQSVRMEVAHVAYWAECRLERASVAAVKLLNARIASIKGRSKKDIHNAFIAAMDNIRSDIVTFRDQEIEEVSTVTQNMLEEFKITGATVTVTPHNDQFLIEVRTPDYPAFSFIVDNDYQLSRAIARDIEGQVWVHGNTAEYNEDQKAIARGIKALQSCVNSAIDNHDKAAMSNLLRAHTDFHYRHTFTNITDDIQPLLTLSKLVLSSAQYAEIYSIMMPLHALCK